MKKINLVTIICLFLILLIIIFIFLSILIIVYKYRNPYSALPLCNEGQCTMDLRTGMKNCDTLSYNPSFEVCVDQNNCDYTQMQYAVNMDGSTTYFGPCETENCRCSPYKSCSSFTLVSFNLDGNSYQQTSLIPNGINKIDDSSFCSINAQSLFNMNGGCSYDNSLTRDENILNCIQLNPCLNGSIAYIANPSSFTSSSLYLYPLSCVVGTPGVDSFGDPINYGSVPIWDAGWGGIVQKKVT